MTSRKGILPPDPLFCFRDAMGPVHTLCYPKRNPDYSDQLLAATEKGDVLFYDLESNRLQLKQNMGESIQALHSIETDIITQEKSGLIKLWSIEKTSYKVQKSFSSYGGFCKSIVLDDHQQLLVAQDKGHIDAIDLNNFETVKQFVPDKTDTTINEWIDGTAMCLESFQFSGTTYLLVGFESGQLILYDYNAGKQCCCMQFKEFITSVKFDPGTGRGVIASASNALQIFRIDFNCLEFKLLAELPLINNGCQIVRFRPDFKLFMTGGWDGSLRVYSWRTLRDLAILREHKKEISDIKFSPSIVRNWDSKIFASGGADGTIALWNVYHSYTY